MRTRYERFSKVKVIRHPRWRNDMERLEEIKHCSWFLSDGGRVDVRCLSPDDVNWLISEVERLREALEECTDVDEGESSYKEHTQIEFTL